jgi:hypothetical protein
MKTKLLLISLLLAVGCEPGDKQTGTGTEPSLKGVSFAGDDGSSIEKAVIIKAPNNFVGIRAEYHWIRKNHPDWQLEQQSVVNAAGRVYDKMDFHTLGGQPVTLYFDITDFFEKM